MYDIVILTEKRYLKPTKKNWYINQVLEEDSILFEEIKKLGLKVGRKDWNDENFIWNNTKLAIFRSTWDYFDKITEFTSWIKSNKSKTTFLNSYELIKWNINKSYLNELKENNINIAKTKFINKDNFITLKELFHKTKFKVAVIKPSISGAAKNTFKINLNNYLEHENLFKNLIFNENSEMIFQEFLYSIYKNGEISLIVINGQFTHAIKKIAKKGDFRVQDDHGGKVINHIATKQEIEFAETCIKKCPFKPIYSRVDIIYDNNNEISLSELELIEPELWFRKNRKSARKLAKAIKNNLFF